MTKAIGVIVGDVVEWHAPSVVAGFDTLCGLDAHDSCVDTYGVMEAKKGQKITCVQCKTIWLGVREMRLRQADFE